MNAKLVYGGILIATVIAIAGLIYPKLQVAAGGITNYDAVETASLSVGASGCDNSFGTCTGTAVTSLITGTCTPTPGVATLAASTSAMFYCSVTGVSSGDKVFVSLPSGAGSNGAQTPGEGFHINGASATSSNYIQFSVSNDSGAATTTFTHWIAGTQYWVVR